MIELDIEPEKKETPGIVTWGESHYGGNTSSVATQLTDIVEVYHSGYAFAALKSDKTVVTWGEMKNGGDSSSVNDQLTDVKHIASTRSAFAALKADGSVVTWGYPKYGGDCSEVADQLTDVVSVHGAWSAFAALKSDGTIVAWGDPLLGGDCSSVERQLNGVEKVHATRTAFAAITKHGNVVCWGDKKSGGDCSAVRYQLNDIARIYSTGSSFAALKNDGSVVTWGYGHTGGDSTAVKDRLTNIVDITTSRQAFCALNRNGTVVTWGDSTYGGDSSKVKKQLYNIDRVYSNWHAFLAIKKDGNIVTWGDPNYGADTRILRRRLTGEIVEIYSTWHAFAALKSDGTVIAWGDENNGGDARSVQSQLTDIAHIFATGFAFMACRKEVFHSSFKKIDKPRKEDQVNWTTEMKVRETKRQSKGLKTMLNKRNVTVGELTAKVARLKAEACSTSEVLKKASKVIHELGKKKWIDRIVKEFLAEVKSMTEKLKADRSSLVKEKSQKRELIQKVENLERGDAENKEDLSTVVSELKDLSFTIRIKEDEMKALQAKLHKHVLSYAQDKFDKKIGQMWLDKAKAFEFWNFIDKSVGAEPLLDVFKATEDAKEMDNLEFQKLLKMATGIVAVNAIIPAYSAKKWVNLDDAEDRKDELEREQFRRNLSIIAAAMTSGTLFLIFIITFLNSEISRVWLSSLSCISTVYLVTCVRMMLEVRCVRNIPLTCDNIMSIVAGLVEGSTGGASLVVMGLCKSYRRGSNSENYAVLDDF